jgi:Tol biopolymer transport system component
MKRQIRPRPDATLLLLFLGLAGHVMGDTIQPASLPDPAQPAPAGGGGDSYDSVISPDGRYVLFASAANNLVLNNNLPLPLLGLANLNVFLRDRTNGSTTLVSVNHTGTGGGNDDSIPAGISTDGRFVVFESSARDLVSNDTNGAPDVFVRDLVAGTTLLVSVSTNSSVGNGASRSSVMTPDGRCVAFVSSANNLVPNDTNGIPDVFVRDLQSSTTALVSVGARSTSRNFAVGSSESPDITPDGRFVAFGSTASNLVAGVATAGDIYVRDLTAGATFWVSTYARPALKSLNRSTNAVCYNHVISADGQFVAYEASPAPGQTSPSAGVVLRYCLGTGLTDLVHTNGAVDWGGMYEDIRSLDMTPDGRFIAFVANTNGTAGDTTCVYLWDAQTSTSTLASGNLSGSAPTGSTCDGPVLDDSGRFVAFLSNATNIVTNTVIGEYHLYMRDVQQATTTLVDAGTNSVGVGVNPATGAAISASGRVIAFGCVDGNLVPNDSNHRYDVFVRDLWAAAPELISARDVALPSDSPNASSLLSAPSVSADGHLIAFASEADNMVANDTNGCRDVFVRDLLRGTNLLVSIATNGTATGDGISADPAISGDGRYVAFSSRADNLVPDDTNNAQDVFVRDLQTATTLLVSVRNGGGNPGNGGSYSPLLSTDGRYVLFRSKANNLAAGSFSGTENLFLRDMQSGITYPLTTTGAGLAAMTQDGHFVAFGGATASVSVWDSLAAAKVYTNTTASAVSAIGISPDGNRVVYSLAGQLYAADRAANTNGLIGSLISSIRSGLRFSADGRFLASAAPLNGTNQVFLYDFQTGTNLLVSRNYISSGPAYGASDSPDVSADGRFVAYRSAAADIVPADNNSVPDVFLYDRLSNSTTLLSVNRFGNASADNRSLGPAFSADGQTIAFQSWASDLISGDFNQAADIFAYSIYSSGQIPLFSAAIVPGAGQGASISWPVVPGRSYAVQFKNSLSDPVWQDLKGNVTVVGSQGSLNDPSSGLGPRFYRVVAF